MPELNHIAELLTEIRDLLRAREPEKEWLSLSSIARGHADIGERMLRHYLWHAERPLPSRRVGGKILVHKDDFDQWVRSFPRGDEAITNVVNEILQDIR